MRLMSDGTPIVQTRADENVMLMFVSRVVAVLYHRLPRMVKWFISEDKLARVIEASIKAIAQGDSSV